VVILLPVVVCLMFRILYVEVTVGYLWGAGLISFMGYYFLFVGLIFANRGLRARAVRGSAEGHYARRNSMGAPWS
jgi:hypothetical protein